MEVTLLFKYSQDEYVKGQRQYLLASKIITKTSMVVIPICLLFALLYLFISLFNVLSIVVFVIVLLALIIECTVYFYMPIYKFKHTSKYQEEYNLKFTKEEINFKTLTIDSKLKWDIYHEFWESNDFYFLIQAPQMYTLIPKRIFENIAIQQAFEDIVSLNLKYGKRRIET